MADIIKQDGEIFGNYYSRINDLILKTKQKVINIEIIFWKIN